MPKVKVRIKNATKNKDKAKMPKVTTRIRMKGKKGKRRAR